MSFIKSVAEIIGKLLLTLVTVIVLLIIVFLIYFMLAGFSISDLEGAISSQWAIYAQMIVFMAAAFGMYALFERKRGWTFGLKQPGAVPWAIRGLLAGFLLMTVSALLIWLLGGIEWEWIGLNQLVLHSLLDGLLLFVGVAVYEEIFSRGYVQGLIRYHYGSIVAITVSSLLFAILHGFNPGTFDSPFPIINLLLAGILLAVSREVSGGLWMPIGLHLTWNYSQGYVYGFKVSGTDTVHSVLATVITGPDVLSGGAFGAEGSLITTIVTLAGIAAVYVTYRKTARAS
ncbi:CPBP family intramembrane glutamic endopeptidase [Paenibacillus harenae]|uniref:CPBP family intramembrane glutamic endopeptidase n=1 Tax=Paenibacillus harenae TaxID=306543 RepID=UPI00146B18D0|nr:type II CAAX endopeptidase family protein [Paenibacillus harenae]